MTIHLEEIVPFGRSMDEYRKMFSLTGKDIARKIVGVADGPASFNAEMSAAGGTVVSVDPLYAFSAGEIERRFHSVAANIIAQVKATPGDWAWSYHKSPEDLQETRTKVLQAFVADYEGGMSKGRYVPGGLPTLNFDSNRFDLALCSHFLFLYSDHLSYEFHRISLREMLRIAPEVRIFPLLTLTQKISPYVQPLIEELKFDGYAVSIEKVEYELQRGGNEMLRIQSPG